MPRYWLGIDQGSTATKACLVDRWGAIRQLVSIPISTRRATSDRVEHDSKRLFDSIKAALRQVLQRVDPAEVGAVGVTAQRSTFVIWDPDTGRSLTPAISWQDRRSQRLCQSLSHHKETIRQKTGLRLSPHYAASKIRWLLQRDLSLRRRAERGKALIGTLDVYLLYRLTRGECFSTDPTHAARTLLMNVRRLDWDEKLLDLFRVPHRALPPVRASALPRGHLRIGRASIPLTASLGDQQAALLGLGCLRGGEAGINYGTGAFVVLNTGKRLRRVPGMLSSVAWSSEKEVRYLVEGTVNSAGTLVEWIRRVSPEGEVPRRGSIELDRIPVVIPSLAGLAAPHWVSTARGAILDFDSTTSAGDLRVGALVGIGCRVLEIVERLRRNGLCPRRIVTGGGLTRFPLLLSLQASLLEQKLHRSRQQESTARGAALLAGHAAGHWNLERDRRLRFPAEKISPALPPVAARRFYRRFREGIRQVVRYAG